MLIQSTSTGIDASSHPGRISYNGVSTVLYTSIHVTNIVEVKTFSKKHEKFQNSVGERGHEVLMMTKPSSHLSLLRHVSGSLAQCVHSVLRLVHDEFTCFGRREIAGVQSVVGGCGTLWGRRVAGAGVWARKTAIIFFFHMPFWTRDNILGITDGSKV